MVEYGDARMKNFASDVILAKNQMHIVMQKFCGRTHCTQIQTPRNLEDV